MKNSFVIALVLCVSFACAQNKGAPPADMSQQLADRIVASEIPVLVDFWAAWCGPCRYLDPVIEELEKEYKGKALFMKVDVDVHRSLAAYFKVNAVPMVYIIEDKTVRSAFNGVRDKKTYKNAIDAALKLAAQRKAPPPRPDQQPDPKEPCLNC